MDWHAQIFLGTAVVSRPLPSLIKHLSVKLADVFVGRHPNRFGAVGICPRPGLENVLSLPLIKFLPRSQIRDKAGNLLRRKGRACVVGSGGRHFLFLTVSSRIRFVSSSI